MRIFAKNLDFLIKTQIRHIQYASNMASFVYAQFSEVTAPRV